jgi:hypothetical protein
METGHVPAVLADPIYKAEKLEIFILISPKLIKGT